MCNCNIRYSMYNLKKPLFSSFTQVPTDKEILDEPTANLFYGSHSTAQFVLVNLNPDLWGSLA